MRFVAHRHSNPNPNSNQAPKMPHASILVQTDEVACVELGVLEGEQERRHVAEEEAAGLRRP